ncbi:MAG: hypothetical protein AABX55_02850 [Nanoarchaeota archaeon]
MNLFKKRCEYCRIKIEKDKEVKRDVKLPGYIGTHPKSFCSEEHAKRYEQESEEHTKTQRKSGGRCC